MPIGARPQDPVTLLKEEHREAKQMLKILQDSKPGARRQQTVQKLVTALLRHMELEERLVYPLVKNEVDPEAAEEATIEHNLARNGLAQMTKLVSEPGFGAAVAMVSAGINHHVKEEETEIFPKLKREVERSELQRLGAELAAGKKAPRR
jgi:hemerythrin-like domain-containing protein